MNIIIGIAKNILFGVKKILFWGFVSLYPIAFAYLIVTTLFYHNYWALVPGICGAILAFLLPWLALEVVYKLFGQSFTKSLDMHKPLASILVMLPFLAVLVPPFVSPSLLMGGGLHTLTVWVIDGEARNPQGTMWVVPYLHDFYGKSFSRRQNINLMAVATTKDGRRVLGHLEAQLRLIEDPPILKRLAMLYQS